MTRRPSRVLGPKSSAILAAALLAGLLPAACGRRERAATPPERLVLFGIDGADWQRALPLVRTGKMPVLARLVRGGTRRTLHSLPKSERGPDWLSPTIWTSVATGVLPERHGILHFVKQAPDGGVQPVTSNQRKVGALWNMLTARGLSVGVVGWLVTWPAEPVDGYMVSSYSPYVVQWGPDVVNRPIKGTIVPGVPHQVWPEELQVRLEELKVPADSVTDEEIVARFTHAPLPAARSDDVGKSLEGLRWAWASDRTYERVIEELSAHPPGGRRPLLQMLYFGSVDVLSHRFWKYMEPSTYAFGSVDPAEIEAFGQAVESAYRSVDGTLGHVLQLEGDSVRVMVLSDHGFRENRDPERPTSGWHRPQGIFAACGPGLAAGVLLPEGSVIDVAPTVLYALGLPIADDFDGRPALDVFTKEFRAEHPVSSIPSWEPEVARTRAEAPVESPVDAQILERLKSLGYLQ